MAPPRLPPEDVQNFRKYLSSNDCDKLLNMVNRESAELFLHTFDEELLRSALHVAILKGSQPLIDALIEKMKAYFGGNDSELVEHEFILKEDKFGLSVAHMAALIGNKEIISSLSTLGLEFYDYHEGHLDQNPTSEDEKKDLLENAISFLNNQAPSSSDQGTRPLFSPEWLDENKFVYCLHAAAMNRLPSQNNALQFVEQVCDNGGVSYLEPLLKVQDSLGRTPLHVHDNDDCPPLFQKLVDHFPSIDWDMPDFCGRTPLHWAVAQGNVALVNFLAKKTKANLNAKYEAAYGITVKLSEIFNHDGVMNVTPLHVAVIHNHVKVVEALLEIPKERGLNVNAVCRRPYKYLDGTTRKDETWTPIQLAAYMGHTQILRKLWKDQRSYDSGFKKKTRWLLKVTI